MAEESANNGSEVIPETDESRNGHGGQMAFHDPEWLSWWLSTHYMLTPEQQVQMANHLLQTIFNPDSREVLLGFIAYTENQYGLNEIQKPEVLALPELQKPIERDLSYFGIFRSAFGKYRMMYYMAFVMACFYAVKGVFAIASLIH